MKFSAIDYQLMALALKEAKKGMYTTDPNPRVGCVLARKGQVVGTGWHQQAGEAHAEVNAIRSAGKDASGADCYVTLEPCSHQGRTGPCAEALIRAGIKRVVVALRDPNPLVSGRGIAMLQQAGITTDTGCLSSEAERLNAGFLKRMRTGLPLVRVKMAVSLDGRTALGNGVSQWITGPEARQDVQKLRARSSAVLTGSGTLEADNPSLTVRSDSVHRLSNGHFRQPKRVVLDGSGKSEPVQHLFTTAQDAANNAQRAPNQSTALIFTLPRTYPVLKAKAFPRDVHIVQVPEKHPDRIDLRKVLISLGQFECNEILVEAGAVLAGAFIAEQLVDEIWVYQASRIIGNSGRGAFQLPEYDELTQLPKTQLVDLRQIGADIRIILKAEQ